MTIKKDKQILILDDDKDIVKYDNFLTYFLSFRKPLFARPKHRGTTPIIS